MYDADIRRVPARPLQGRCIVVTGAAGGIGGECARQAAADGAAVVLADRDADRLQATVVGIAQCGGEAVSVEIDITRSNQCALLMDTAVQHYGRLDGAVLSAGIARHLPILEMSPDDWEEMLDIHLTGAFLCLQAAARIMVRGRGGSVVYVGSSAAAGLGPLHQAHYVAAKAGALGLVRAAARELGGQGVRVNAVSPGFTDTAMNAGLFSEDEVNARMKSAPLGRVAVPADVANTVTFLLGDQSGFMTGQTLHVNGGTHMP